MTKLWMKNGIIVMDVSNRVVLCPDCPCNPLLPCACCSAGTAEVVSLVLPSTFFDGAIVGLAALLNGRTIEASRFYVLGTPQCRWDYNIIDNTIDVGYQLSGSISSAEFAESCVITASVEISPNSGSNEACEGISGISLFYEYEISPQEENCGPYTLVGSIVSGGGDPCDVVQITDPSTSELDLNP